MLKILEFTMDYMKQSMGGNRIPQFAWKADSDRKNVKQKGYRLQISKENEFTNLVYDSGEIQTEQSSQICPDTILPESFTRYYVRVKIWDNFGEESLWSDPVCFLTSYLKPEEWKGKFITGEEESDSTTDKGIYLRKSFFVEKEVKEAYLTATARGLYHASVNGEAAGKDEMAPGWTSYRKRLLYQTYDVTALIRKGENVLGAHLGSGWYKGTMGFVRKRNLYGSHTAFLANLCLRYEDGTEEWIVTDDSWKASDSPVSFSDIYDGEIYDARKEQPGWDAPGFSDQNWKSVTACEADKSILVPQTGCKVKELIPVAVKEIIITPEGDTVLDFGQNLTGWVHMKIKGKKGEKAVLNCFEILDAKGNVYTENLRTAKETLTYICGEEEEREYRPHFTFQGFRYIKIAEYPGEVKKENFTAWAVHSQMEDTGYFQCSNSLLNQLQHNIEWGLKGNFLDIPTDCPQRDERLGWTGDAQIFCRTALFLKNAYPFFSKWLKDLAADQSEEGAVPHVIPDILTDRAQEDWLLKEGSAGAAAWADAAVIVPWNLYLTYRDVRIIEEQYDSMKGWIDFMTTHAEDGIWKLGRQFGDWVALDAEEGSYFGATPDELICTAYYAWSTDLFSKMAGAAGHKEEERKYAELAEKVKESYRRHFITEDGHLTARTQTAQIVTLYFHLALEKDRKKILQDLQELLKEQDGHLVTGFVGTPYFCHVLSENGCTKEAYDLLLKEDFPSWLYQVKMGATTVWEHWDGMKPDGTMWSPDMNSFNHYAYGAIGEWLYRVVAGIEADPNRPGYAHIRIQPHTGGNLTWAEGKYDSIYGWIISKWSLEQDKVYLHVKIPVNTEATIVLEEGAVPVDDQEIKFVKENGQFQGKTGSGEYEIVYRI